MDLAYPNKLINPKISTINPTNAQPIITKKIPRIKQDVPIQEAKNMYNIHMENRIYLVVFSFERKIYLFSVIPNPQ